MDGAPLPAPALRDLARRLGVVMQTMATDDMSDSQTPLRVRLVERITTLADVIAALRAAADAMGDEQTLRWATLRIEVDEPRAPPTFHAPSLADEESQPAHADTLPDGLDGDADTSPPPIQAPPPEPPPTPAAKPPLSLPRITRTPPPAPKRLWRITLTPAQEEKLRELWHQLDVSAVKIRKALSAMDGPPVQSDATLYRLAAKLGLRLRSVLLHEQQEAEEAADATPEPAPAADHSADADEKVAAPEPAPSPARAPTPAQDAHGQTVRASAHVPTKGALLPATQDSEKAEAFEAFDAGQTVRDVAADLGIPLSTLSNWHAEWKLRARKDAAA
jgi:hypothetical protein